MQAETFNIESEEDGFYAVVTFDEEIPALGGYSLRFRIQEIDLDAFYEQVRGRILPYLRERDEARTSRPVEFYDQDPDFQDGAYPLSSPKHPNFHSIHADLYDQREGK